MIKKRTKKLRPNSTVKIIYKTTRFIISFCVYLIRLFKNPKLIRFIIPYITSNLDPNSDPIKDELPWITFAAKEWLEDFLIKNKNLIVFEYGSGGSTIFFSKRVKKLISIEHNRAWYQVISRILQEKNIQNCEYLLLEPKFVSDDNLDFSDPQGFASSEYPNMCFEEYVKSINMFPDKSFDLILIDGRARPSCILYARNKVKLGRVLMLDNSERNYYLLGKELLTDWEQTDFFGPGPYGHHFWQTSIWRRSSNK